MVHMDIDRQCGERRRPPWAMLGLLLVVAFLAHDAIMANGAHAVASGASHSAVDHASRSVEHPNIHGEASAPTECDIARPANLRGESRRHSFPTAALGLQTAPLEHDALWIPTARFVRIVDPDVRRALLQVYRI